MAGDYDVYETKMMKTLDALQSQFGAVRAGRASAAVLEPIRVDYYGVPTPISQMATVASPDPRTLTIQPWDKTTLKAIEKAILISDLGDRKSTRLNSSHTDSSRMPSSA